MAHIKGVSVCLSELRSTSHQILCFFNCGSALVCRLASLDLFWLRDTFFFLHQPNHRISVVQKHQAQLHHFENSDNVRRLIIHYFLNKRHVFLGFHMPDITVKLRADAEKVTTGDVQVHKIQRRTCCLLNSKYHLIGLTGVKWNNSLAKQTPSISIWNKYISFMFFYFNLQG